MRRILVVLVVLLNFCLVKDVVGQERPKLQISQGIGVSSLSLSTIHTFYTNNFESELYFLLFPWMETSYSLNYVRLFPNEQWRDSSYLQFNANIYAIFYNRKRIGVNIGTGFSIFDLDNISKKYLKGYTPVGFNLILEPRINITKCLIIRLKFMVQLYQNKNINYGAIVKFGYKLNG